MFTGIVTHVGKIAALEPQSGELRVRIAPGEMYLSDVQIGDSIAVSGVCLTVAKHLGGHFCADVSGETLMRTTFSQLKNGDRVNLEKALMPTSRLGGHFVTGHIDGTATVLQLKQQGSSLRLRINTPADFAKYIAEKGSVCIDGVSLTVNKVENTEFECNIVPHTRQHTIIGDYVVGAPVNLEVDLIARYLERLLLGSDATDSASGVTRELLSQYGFIK